MAKKIRFKPTPAGIMFLSAIAVLLIAIIVLTVMAVKNCNTTRTVDPDADASAVASIEPVDSALPSTEPIDSTEPIGSADPVDPSATPDDTDPDNTASADPSADPSGSASIPPVVVNTPTSGTDAPASGSAEPTATPGPTYYTKPTSAMKKNAQKGYVSHDKVNMRKEPNKNSTLVKEKIAKNTELTLYVEQEGWWFVKCGDKYGYIKKDYVAKGSAPSTPSSTEATGKVLASTIALRKEPDKGSTCIKQYYNGESLKIFYYKKDGSGRKWYYVKTSDGKTGFMFAEYIKVTSGKVNEKN